MPCTKIQETRKMMDRRKKLREKGRKLMLFLLSEAREREREKEV